MSSKNPVVIAAKAVLECLIQETEDRSTADSLRPGLQNSPELTACIGRVVPRLSVWVLSVLLLGTLDDAWIFALVRKSDIVASQSSN